MKGKAGFWVGFAREIQKLTKRFKRYTGKHQKNFAAIHQTALKFDRNDDRLQVVRRGKLCGRVRGGGAFILKFVK